MYCQFAYSLTYNFGLSLDKQRIYCAFFKLCDDSFAFYPFRNMLLYWINSKIMCLILAFPLVQVFDLCLLLANICSLHEIQIAITRERGSDNWNR